MAVIQRPKGTRDFAPEEMERRRRFEAALRDCASRYGFREVGTPTIEQEELFTAKSGAAVVEDMYTFRDKGGRRLCLRPELTAPVARFFSDSLQDRSRPLKLFYFGNVFRYEEPQSGRYREFWQFGVEVVGCDSAAAEAEIIALASEMLAGGGIKNCALRVGHVGLLREAVARVGIPEERRKGLFPLIDKGEPGNIRQYIEESASAEAAAQFIALLTSSGPPERALPALKAAAPWAAAPLARLEEVVALLEAAGCAAPAIDPRIVRGLDYYTGTVFEFHCSDLGAESQVCGGGTYELAGAAGGIPTPSTGFGLGFDRALLAAEKSGVDMVPSRPDAFVVPVGARFLKEAVAAAAALRRAGLRADTDLMGRSLSKNMACAGDAGFRFALIIGEKEAARGVVTVRDMATGEQREMTVEEAGRVMERRHTTKG